MQEQQISLQRPSVQALFAGYYHDEQIAESMKRDGTFHSEFNGKSESTKQATTVVMTRGD